MSTKSVQVLIILMLFFTVGLMGCSSETSNNGNQQSSESKNDGSQSSASKDDGKVWELKLGSKMVENHLESEAVKMFIELVDQKTNGKVKITPYFGEALGNSKVQLENVMTGVQDFYVESYTFFANYVPEFRVHSLPYFFSGNEEYQEFLLSPIEEEMEEKLVEKNIRIINEDKNWLRGPYRMIVSREPIKSLDDVQGLKLRQPDNQATIKAWSQFGANPSIIPYSETYLAMQQGMVDAVTVPIANLKSDKFYELVKYATVTHEYQQQVAIVINEMKYQSLPEEYQKAIIESVNEAGVFNTKNINEEGNKLRKSLIEENGMEIFEIDLNPFREKAKAVHKLLEEEGFVPEGITERIHEYLENN